MPSDSSIIRNFALIIFLILFGLLIFFLFFRHAPPLARITPIPIYRFKSLSNNLFLTVGNNNRLFAGAAISNVDSGWLPLPAQAFSNITNLVTTTTLNTTSVSVGAIVYVTGVITGGVGPQTFVFNSLGSNQVVIGSSAFQDNGTNLVITVGEDGYCTLEEFVNNDNRQVFEEILSTGNQVYEQLLG